jgi:3-oxoacyl-[acyl-carrier-protein] synthase-3
MKYGRAVKISGTGMHVPPKVVTNHDLAKLMDTTDEWIQQRSGIKERRYVEDGVTPTDIAFEAAQAALDKAGLKGSDIDLLVVATLSPEHFFPGNSSFLQDRLGMGTAPALDVRCQCTGFLYALNVGQLFVASGQYNKVMVVGVEIHSRGVELATRGRDVAVLFGDGAGAVILEPAEKEDQGFLSIHLHAEGKYADKLWVEAPGMAHSPNMISEAMLHEGKQFPYMDGRFVFKNAVTRMPEVIREGLSANNLTTDDVDFFLFHQANMRINEFVAGQLKVPAEKTYNNIQKYGNCSAASIPICLAECVDDGKIKRGDLVAMTGFGSGFTWGTALVRF